MVQSQFSLHRCAILNSFFFQLLFERDSEIKFSGLVLFLKQNKKMYENSSSPVSARQQQHEAEIIRRMNAARSSAFNVVAPYSLEAQQQNISKGKRRQRVT